MRFSFELHQLGIGDAIKIERLEIATEYTVEEFIAMTNAYPAILETFVKMATDAPKRVAC